MYEYETNIFFYNKTACKRLKVNLEVTRKTEFEKVQNWLSISMSNLLITPSTTHIASLLDDRTEQLATFLVTLNSVDFCHIR